MKTTTSIIVVAVLLIVASAHASTFFVQDVAGLQSSVDSALAGTRTGKAIVFDAQGNKYRVQLMSESGGCRTGMVIDSRNNIAKTSICQRSNSNLRTAVSIDKTPVQQMQYQRQLAPTPTRQSYGGMFKEKPGLQYDLRGNPNSPFMNVDPLNVTTNDIYAMTPAQFEEYQKRVNWVNGTVVPQTARNDREYARNAQTWMGDTNRDRYNNVQNTLSRNFDTLLNRAINSINF